MTLVARCRIFVNVSVGDIDLPEQYVDPKLQLTVHRWVKSRFSRCPNAMSFFSPFGVSHRPIYQLVKDRVPQLPIRRCRKPSPHVENKADWVLTWISDRRSAFGERLIEKRGLMLGLTCPPSVHRHAHSQTVHHHRTALVPAAPRRVRHLNSHVHHGQTITRFPHPHSTEAPLPTHYARVPILHIDPGVSAAGVRTVSLHLRFRRTCTRRPSSPHSRTERSCLSTAGGFQSV